MSDNMPVRISSNLADSINNVIEFLAPDSKWHDDGSPINDEAETEGYLRELLRSQGYVTRS